MTFTFTLVEAPTDSVRLDVLDASGAVIAATRAMAASSLLQASPRCWASRIACMWRLPNTASSG